MEELHRTVKEKNIELLIWDFDGVIFDLEWNYITSVDQFMEELFNEINSIDESIIKNKAEFIASGFPFPEINTVGTKYGKEAQMKAKALFKRKESLSLEKAIPHKEVIEFINDFEKDQVIWSNNISSTIAALLESKNIKDKISYISSLEKVLLSKPDKEGFDPIQKMYPNIKKENILFVGDSLRSDKVASENVGINFHHYVA